MVCFLEWMREFEKRQVVLNVWLSFFFLSTSPRDLDCLGVKNRALVALPVEEVLQTLNDLITYFQLPDAELEHEERQIKLRSLKNRQNLFKQEVSSSIKEGLVKKSSRGSQAEQKNLNVVAIGTLLVNECTCD